MTVTDFAINGGALYSHMHIYVELVDRLILTGCYVVALTSFLY
jgi:hypothetical protein